MQSKKFRSVLTSYMLCVKQGALKNGMVAVKKLSQSTNDLSEKQFLEEVKCLMRVKHQNTVRFLGYCAEWHGELMEIDGKLGLLMYHKGYSALSMYQMEAFTIIFKV